MMAYTKIDDTTVAEVSENRTIYGSTQLANRKIQLEAELQKVNELIAVLNAPKLG